MNLPTGFRFLPTDQELTLTYLKPKANNQPVPWGGMIVERNLYGDHADPWEVFGDDDPWDIPMTQEKDQTKGTKKSLYVITELKRTINKRYERKAGCGTWKAQIGPKKIENRNGETIGSRRMFTFEAREHPDVVKKIHGHWIMHEYSLDVVSLNEHTSNDYVICQITRTLMEPRDQPVVPFADEIGTSIRGGENPRIDEELSKQRYTTVEDWPHANMKEKFQGPSMDDMQEEEIFGNLGDLVPEKKHISFEFPGTGEEFMDLDWPPMKF